MQQYINELSKYVDQKVTLKGWVSGIRSGKGLFFIVMRDGTGFCQVVVSEASVDVTSFEAAGHLTQESSFTVSLKNIRFPIKSMGLLSFPTITIYGCDQGVSGRSCAYAMKSSWGSMIFFKAKDLCKWTLLYLQEMQ